MFIFDIYFFRSYDSEKKWYYQVESRLQISEYHIGFDRNYEIRNISWNNCLYIYYCKIESRRFVL